MSDKFDLDNIKNLLNSSSSGNSAPSFSLDDIMKDFGKAPAEKESEPVVTETAPTDAQEQPDDTVKRPDGYSLTDAFDAIRSEKYSETTVVQQIPQEEPAVSATAEAEEQSAGKEIIAPIEHKRFFTTDTFNSIKDKSPASVRDSIASFANGENDEEDDGEEEFFKPHEPTEEIDDYEKQEDREDIIGELKKMNSSASLIALFTFILTVVSGLFFAVANSWISLPGVDYVADFKIYTIVVAVISIIATIANINSVIKGVKSALKLRFSPETYIVLMFLFSTALNAFYIFTPKTDGLIIVSFDFIYMLHLLFNIYSKKLTAKTVYKNFLISSADGAKSVVNKPNNEEAVNDIMLETGCSADIVYASKTEFVSDFITKSFKDFEPFDTVLNTVLAIAVLVLAVVSYFIKGSFSQALIYAASALCATLPVLFGVSFALPLFFNSNKTRRQGGVIVGSRSAEELKDVQTFIVDDADVFNTSLNGIRLYGDALIDDAILYLNALYGKVGGPLSKLFADMLSEDIVSLPRIDEIYYHDTMGYSGLIHSKVFVAGNKKLMDHFGVEVDDSEYEIIYQQKSKHVLFVAYDGKLMGVFLLAYSLSHGVSKAFEICEKNQIAVCIVERDASINEKTLFNAYEPKEKLLFNIISFRTARNCFDKFELHSKMPSLLISHTGIKGLAAALRSCKTMSFAFKTNRIITSIASVMAVPLVTFLLLFSDPSASLPVQVLAYQALWAIPILFVSLFSK